MKPININERSKAIARMKQLIESLNHYRDCYYNHDKSLVSDAEYDNLFDELAKLEIQTGIVYPDSPTQSVGYKVQNGFKKVTHDHPMLSLDKTKEWPDVIKWARGKDIVGMLKCDGLTCSLTYGEDGYLQQAETRGDGAVGELITENVKAVSNIPQRIFTGGQKLTVDGEMIVKTDVFEKMNKNLSDDDKFSHPRNYASGSIRQLDVNITKERNLSFIAWKYVEGENKTNSFNDNLDRLEELGFEVVPHFLIPDTMVDEKRLETFKDDMYKIAEWYMIPLDGLVFSFNDIAFGESLGMTGHHPLHSYAYKVRQDIVETTLRDIEWSVGKSGIVAPTAIFDPVDLLGAVTSRATLHNLSYIWDLGIDIGSKIGVIRANEVIPRVEKNLGELKHYDNYPRICPSCGQSLTMEKSITQYREGKGNQVTGKKVGPITLRCENPNCPAKNLARFVQFVSKAGMNIDGLSEATLEKFIDLGYIKTFEDIYLLYRYKDGIINLEGFGEKSWNKLWKSIEKSKNCKLENYLVALSIPLIGKTAAKTISKYFKGNYQEFVNACCSGFDFTQLEDFGDKMNESVHNWFNDDYRITNLEGSNLIKMLNFEEEPKVEVDEDNFCFGKTFVVTGKFSKPRSYYEELITSNGGKLAGSVSKKTDFLLTDNPDSGSSKAVKAKSLGIPVLSEDEFMSKVGN